MTGALQQTQPRPSDTISLKSSTPSGPPPSYSRHHNDELLSTPANSILGRSRQQRQRRLSISRTQSHPSVAQLLSVLTSHNALHLTIDQGLIYPPPPSNALYHLPRVLTWSGNEIYLFRSLPALARRRNDTSIINSNTRDLALYTIRRTPFTHEVALLPRREGLRAGVMRGKRSIWGNMSWEVEVKGKTVLKYSKGKWKDGSTGKVVATEKQVAEPSPHGVAEQDEYSPGPREEISLAEGLEIAMKDLIVAAWCTRIWQGHGRVSLARTLMRGEGMPLKREIFMHMRFSG
jgi:hypothetical protein